jgi:hypothetical protein
VKRLKNMNKICRRHAKNRSSKWSKKKRAEKKEEKCIDFKKVSYKNVIDYYTVLILKHILRISSLSKDEGYYLFLLNAAKTPKLNVLSNTKKPLNVGGKPAKDLRTLGTTW